MIPINVDRNVSIREYDHLDGADAFWITHTFFTFQGEGPFGGYPAVFVRLAGCNIGAKQDCPWCDTDFTYSRGAQMPFSALHDLLDAWPGSSAQVVVFTGGEPLLQARSISAFVAERRAMGCRRNYQIETNGLLLRAFYLNSDLFYVISPKIPHGKAQYHPLPEWLANVREGLAWKFVVSGDPTSPYHKLPSDMARCAAPVYVSGMTHYRRSPRAGEVASIWDSTLIDPDATASSYRHAAQLALRYGLRVSYQTHLFGAQP
jgi:organic radical activating enzyme